MSRRKKDELFGGEQPLSESVMLAYLRNELSAEEKAVFEKQLEEDPFAADALEGLRAAQAPLLAEKLASIKKQVREKSGVKETKRIHLHWSTYAWAAVVFGVLLGVGFLLINYVGDNQRDMAMNKEPDQEINTSLFEEQRKTETLQPVTTTVTADSVTENITAAKPVESVTVAEKEATVSAAVKDVPAEKPLPAPPPAKEDLSTFKSIENKQIKATEVQKKNDLSDAAKAPAAGYAAREETVTEMQVVTATGAKKITAQKETGEAEALNDKRAKSTSPATLDDAMKTFNNGNYTEAARQFDEVLKKTPDNSEALYFGGISEYINGNNKKSEKNFDQLLKTNRYTEGSKWYKANILLKKGKREEAVKLLQELSATNGSYKERAIKKLEEVK